MPNTENPPTPPQLTWPARLRSSPATLALMAVNVAVFALAERSGSTQSTDTLLRFGACWRELVWNGEVWRLFTSMFLHIGPTHLLWKVFFGLGLCSQVEGEVGKAGSWRSTWAAESPEQPSV
jgi:rhomboid protease GluP